jgi:HK97 family phage portal protein
LCGNSYVYIQRVNGQVVALWPLHPKKTHPIRLPNGDLAYQTTEGMSGGKTKIYQSSDILHFKLFSWDGLLGLSPIMLARQSLGLTRAAEKMGARLFANNGRPSGVMTLEGNADQKMLLNIRESWQAAQTGENALKTAFLPGNWKYTPISLSMEDIEFLSTRQFQRTEIAALYRVPAHLVGDTTRQSNTNSEQEALSLVTLTLRPYITRIENEIQRVLLPSVGRNANRFFVEFDVRQLLRGDFKTQMEGFQIGRNAGFYSANDIREDIGENPIGPVGDVYLVPVNYTNAENLLKPPEPIQPQPALDLSTAPADPAQPPDTPDTPTQVERSLAHKVSSLTLVVFRDALGRLLHHEKRDLTNITTTFEPVLRSILSLAIDDATKKLGVEWRSQHEVDNIVADVCKAMEKRSEKWSPEQVDETAGEEFRKVLRQIVSSVYKECGASLALQE